MRYVGFWKLTKSWCLHDQSWMQIIKHSQYQLVCKERFYVEITIDFLKPQLKGGFKADRSWNCKKPFKKLHFSQKYFFYSKYQWHNIRKLFPACGHHGGFWRNELWTSNFGLISRPAIRMSWRVETLPNGKCLWK